MNLASTAIKFDNNLFTDVFGSATFYGQIEPFPDSARSGPFTRRRVLSTGPDITIPSRRVVSAGVERFVIASPDYDRHNGAIIRIKYPILPVDGVFTVKTVYQTVLSQAGTADIYAMLYVVNKEAVQDDRDSKFLNFVMYFSNYETIDVDCIVSVGGYFYKTITRSFIDGAGFSAVELVDLGASAVRNVQVISNLVREPSTELWTTATYSSVKALCALSKLFYKFSSIDMKGIEPGDYSYWLPKSVVVAKPIEGSLVDGRRVVACKENPAGVWEVRTRL